MISDIYVRYMLYLKFHQITLKTLSGPKLTMQTIHTQNVTNMKEADKTLTFQRDGVIGYLKLTPL